MSTAFRETVEAPLDRPRRQRHSIADKRRIVEATLAPGTSVARVAREYGVNANLVFGWRRLYQRGLLGGNAPAAALLPVTVSEVAPVAEPDLTPTPAGSVQLRLPKCQVRIEGAIDPATLRVVLECLRG